MTCRNIAKQNSVINSIQISSSKPSFSSSRIRLFNPHSAKDPNGVFERRVDEVRDGVPGYNAIVKHPMAFEMIRVCVGGISFLD